MVSERRRLQVDCVISRKRPCFSKHNPESVWIGAGWPVILCYKLSRVITTPTRHWPTSSLHNSYIPFYNLSSHLPFVWVTPFHILWHQFIPIIRFFVFYSFNFGIVYFISAFRWDSLIDTPKLLKPLHRTDPSHSVIPAICNAAADFFSVKITIYFFKQIQYSKKIFLILYKKYIPCHRIHQRNKLKNTNGIFFFKIDMNCNQMS